MTQLYRCSSLHFFSFLFLELHSSEFSRINQTKYVTAHVVHVSPLFQIKPTTFASSTRVLFCCPVFKVEQYHSVMQQFLDASTFFPVSSQDKKRTTSPERRLSGASSSRSPSPFTVMNDQELYMNGLARTRTASPGEF